MTHFIILTAKYPNEPNYTDNHNHDNIKCMWDQLKKEEK